MIKFKNHIKKILKYIYIFLFPKLIYYFYQKRIQKTNLKYIKLGKKEDRKNNILYGLNMHSDNFVVNECANPYKKLKNFYWDFGSYKNKISVYIDGDVRQGVFERNNGKLKFLWMLESRYYDKGCLEYIKKNIKKVTDTFQEIWTYHEELLSLDKKFHFVPAKDTWIREHKLYSNKTKLISMITSSKTLTPFHKFRYKFALDNKDKIDVYGRSFKSFLYKEDVLKDYAFSIEIENDDSDTYFTEKVLDCFATGTIPIFKGSRKIVNYFNEKGIIFLDDLKNFNEISFELYNEKINAVKDNFERVKDYYLLDEWLFENKIKKYLN